MSLVHLLKFSSLHCRDTYQDLFHSYRPPSCSHLLRLVSTLLVLDHLFITIITVVEQVVSYPGIVVHLLPALIIPASPSTSFHHPKLCSRTHWQTGSICQAFQRLRSNVFHTFTFVAAGISRSYHDDFSRCCISTRVVLELSNANHDTVPIRHSGHGLCDWWRRLPHGTTGPGASGRLILHSTYSQWRLPTSQDTCLGHGLSKRPRTR